MICWVVSMFEFSFFWGWWHCGLVSMSFSGWNQVVFLLQLMHFSKISTTTRWLARTEMKARRRTLQKQCKLIMLNQQKTGNYPSRASQNWPLGLTTKYCDYPVQTGIQPQTTRIQARPTGIEHQSGYDVVISHETLLGHDSCGKLATRSSQNGKSNSYRDIQVLKRTMWRSFGRCRCCHTFATPDQTRRGCQRHLSNVVHPQPRPWPRATRAAKGLRWLRDTAFWATRACLDEFVLPFPNLSHAFPLGQLTCSFGGLEDAMGHRLFFERRFWLRLRHGKVLRLWIKPMNAHEATVDI